jgi:glycosyltransferase involved in cell wall biosynthesis
MLSPKILFVVNVDWFFISHRLPLAIEAKKRGFEVSIATTNTGRFEELETLGFHLYELKIDRSGTNLLNEFISIIKLIKIVKIVHPTVIHNVTLKVSIYSSIASRFVKKSKIINAISGLGYNFTAERKTKSQRIIYALMKYAFKKRGFTFIFQNPDDLLLFQNLEFDQGNKLVLIKGAGVDIGIFKPSERKYRKTAGFILTSRMLKDKGISEYINASKIVRTKYSGAKFILAGDIDKENHASYTELELRKELNGTGIEWLGQRNDIAELLQNSDVMVFPSYREGLPKSLIEAAATGLAIITTDTIGCRECVDEGINGFLVPVGDSILLAQKMIELIEDRILLKKMGRASRIKAENEFSLEMVIERTFALYE